MYTSLISIHEFTHGIEAASALGCLAAATSAREATVGSSRAGVRGGSRAAVAAVIAVPTSPTRAGPAELLAGRPGRETPRALSRVVEGLDKSPSFARPQPGGRAWAEAPNHFFFGRRWLPSWPPRT